MGSGWYASLFGGATWTSDWGDSVGTPLGPYKFEFSSDPGYMLGLATGVNVLPGLRAEVEYSYAAADLDKLKFSFGGASVSFSIPGDMTVQMLLANVWYDFNINAPIRPYVGGGIGYGWTDFSALGGSNDDDGFAYQLGVGGVMPVTNQVSLDVGYRYKAVTGIDLLGGGFSDDVASHNVRAAVVIKLGN